MSRQRPDGVVQIIFDIDEEKKAQFKKRVPNMAAALREVVESYLEEPDAELEDRVYRMRREILRMHLTRLETEIAKMEDQRDDIRRRIDQADEGDHKIIHSVDMGGVHRGTSTKSPQSRHDIDENE